MKTLWEIWNENGCKECWVEEDTGLIYKLVYSNEDVGCLESVNMNPSDKGVDRARSDRDHWTKHTPPTPKKKYYAYLWRKSGQTAFYLKFTDVDGAEKYPNCIRMPHLDFEGE